MLFEAWCAPAAALSWAAPCGRPALRSLGCLVVALPAATAWGLSGTIRGATARLREPGFTGSAAAPSGFVFV